MERRTYEAQAGLYIISVAARLLEMHPQTLRKYERAGFLTPNRTEGMLRLYSVEDIARLRLIKHLVEDLGLNLAGVELGLKLAQHLLQMQSDLENVQDAAELRNRIQQALPEVLSLLGLVPAQEDQRPRRAAFRIEIRARDG